MKYRHTLKPFARKYVILALATAAFRLIIGVLLQANYRRVELSCVIISLGLLFIYIYLYFLYF